MFAMGFDVALSNAAAEAGSARPDAPVVHVATPTSAVRRSRRVTAATLRGLARGTYHLADAVDPVRLPRPA